MTGIQCRSTAKRNIDCNVSFDNSVELTFGPNWRYGR